MRNQIYFIYTALAMKLLYVPPAPMHVKHFQNLLNSFAETFTVISRIAAKDYSSTKSFKSLWKQTLQILQLCSTRWLSMLECINRIVNQYDALSSYFQSCDECDRLVTVDRISTQLQNPIVKCYFSFLSANVHPIQQTVSFKFSDST